MRTLQDIALDLYINSDIGYTREHVPNGSIPQDALAYPGYAQVATNPTEYHWQDAAGNTLSVNEVAGSVPDDTGEPTDTQRTLDYLYCVTFPDGEYKTEPDAVSSEKELLALIKHFIAGE